MLAPASRLRSPAEFRSVLRRGPGQGRGASRCLVVHVSLAEGEDAQRTRTPPRVGFAVSTAVGNAVTRNRVRRRLRALCAARLSGWSEGAEVVVRALPPAAGAGFDQLSADLDRSWAAAVRQAQSPRRVPA